MIRLYILGHHNKVHISSGKDEKNGHWKGGKVLRMGYWYIYKPDHPNVSKDGYVAEHRLIIERHLGRFLEYNEVIHHINENKLDNRIENLKLMTILEHKSHHAKERQRNKDGTFFRH